MKYLNEFQFHILAFIITMAMSLACQPKHVHVAGSQGKDGSSCSVFQLENGAEIKCDDNTSAVILDGVDGATGAYNVVQTITPCFDVTKPLQETLLLLESGALIGHYSHGNKQFLAVLGPGNYVSTDSYSCKFTVTPEMNVVW